MPAAQSKVASARQANRARPHAGQDSQPRRDTTPLTSSGAVDLIKSICRIAGPLDFIDRVRAELRAAGVITAVSNRDTAALVDWINAFVSHQGISDQVADQYLDRHGAPKYAAIAADLAGHWSCRKLTSQWHFVDCGYRKAARTCNAPDLLPTCPLPVHPFRNGRLNQSAYSLALFVRDVADGDLVSWIDRQLADADDGGPSRTQRMAAAVIDPLRNVYGVSDKVLSMILADLFIGVGHRKPLWFDVGVSLIAVDTLVHNFLARTGVVGALGRAHRYGAACYEPAGCVAVIDLAADKIDARQFNLAFPANFPRFIQNAVWRYCAQSHHNICNGNTIDDAQNCTNQYCKLFSICEKNKPI